MIDSGSEVPKAVDAPENIVAETRPEVTAFREKIAKADGTLIPLRKTTHDGKSLYIAARWIGNPFEKESKTANRRFYGWKDREDTMTDVLLVDMYAKEAGKIAPIGHMDWWIIEDYANGGGQMHNAAIGQNKHEKSANERWHPRDYTAFKVDPKYHRQGLGSLMAATSAVALEANRITLFYTGGLLDPAKSTYARFNIHQEDFPLGMADPYETNLPITRLSQHPQVNKTIAEFV